MMDDNFKIGCFGQHPDEPMEHCLECPNENDYESVTLSRRVETQNSRQELSETEEAPSDIDTSAVEESESEPEPAASAAMVVDETEEVSSSNENTHVIEFAANDVKDTEDKICVRSPDTWEVGTVKWFENLKAVSRGKSVITFPDDLKDLLKDHIERAISIEYGSRTSEHFAIADKGRLFCTIHSVIQEYKRKNKGTGLPLEFTVLFIGKNVFGRSRQTLYLWKRVWEAYGDDLKVMTDLTINKLDILTSLEKHKRDEWLTDGRSELIEMDEEALKVLLKKPVRKRVTHGDLVNGYRIVPGRKGTFIKGLQLSLTVEQDGLTDEQEAFLIFLNSLDPGPETDGIEEEEATEEQQRQQRKDLLEEPFARPIMKYLIRHGPTGFKGLSHQLQAWNQQIGEFRSLLTAMKKYGLVQQDSNGNFCVADTEACWFRENQGRPKGIPKGRTKGTARTVGLQ